jgi:hypothetical protein
MSKSSYIKCWDNFFERKDKEFNPNSSPLSLGMDTARDEAYVKIKQIYYNVRDLRECMMLYPMEDLKKNYPSLAKMECCLNEIAENHSLLDYFIETTWKDDIIAKKGEQE